MESGRFGIREVREYVRSVNPNPGGSGGFPTLIREVLERPRSGGLGARIRGCSGGSGARSRTPRIARMGALSGPLVWADERAPGGGVMRLKVDIYLADATRRAAVRQETTRARRCFDPWSQHMHAGVTGPRTSVAAELVSSSPLDHPISSCRQMQGHPSKHF